MALKLKFVKGRGYDTYESKEKKKEHKDESVVFTETGDDEEEEQEEVARVTYVNNIMYSIFSNVEVYINNQQIYNSNGLYADKPYISTTLRQPSLNTRGFCIVKAMTMNKILRILVTPYLIAVLQGE